MRDEFERFAEGLKTRILMFIGRCVITAVNDGGQVQTVQGRYLADEPIDDVEHIQQYGFTSVPLAGAEGVVVFMGGNRDHGVMIASGDRRYRIKGMTGGEVALFDDIGHAVLLKRNGIVIDGAGQKITLKNTPMVRMESSLDVTGEVRDRCDDPAPKSMADMRAHQTGHTHKTNAIGEQTDPALQEI